MTLGGPPETKQRFPGFTGKIVADTWRGKVRLRKWPKKRGRPKSAQVRLQNERFTEAQRLAKRAPGSIQADAIRATLNTGLYPRDLMTKAILVGLMEVELPDGRLIRHGRRRLETVEFQGFALQLTANQAVTGGVAHQVSWPLPLLDTAGFFDISAPTIVTVPDGVAVMSFSGNFETTTGTGVSLFYRIERVSGSSIRPAYQGLYTGYAANLSTGPMLVAPGEQYALITGFSAGKTLLAASTRFSGQILAAEV